MCYSITIALWIHLSFNLTDLSSIKGPKDTSLCGNSWHMLIIHRFTILIMFCSQMAFAGVTESTLRNHGGVSSLISIAQSGKTEEQTQ